MDCNEDNEKKSNLKKIIIIIIICFIIPGISLSISTYYQNLRENYTFSQIFYISASAPDNYGFTGSSFDNEGDQTIFEYSSNVSIDAYLLTEAQFQYFYIYRTIGACIGFIFGMTGYFTHVHYSSSHENIILLFVVNQDARIFVAVTENRKTF